MHLYSHLKQVLKAEGLNQFVVLLDTPQPLFTWQKMNEAWECLVDTNENQREVNFFCNISVVENAMSYLMQKKNRHTLWECTVGRTSCYSFGPSLVIIYPTFEPHPFKTLENLQLGYTHLVLI